MPDIHAHLYIRPLDSRSFSVVRLTGFRVTNFRNVIDSGDIAAEPDVTCLVGKNESGKTALLQALYRTKPVDAATFEEGRHYPRQNLVAHRRKDQINGTAAVTAHFALDDAELADLESTFGHGVLRGGSITTVVGYGIDSGRLSVSEPAAINAFVHRIMAENEPGSGELLNLKTLKELAAACQAKVAAEDAAQGADPETATPSAQRYRDLLLEMGEVTTQQALLNAVWARLKPRIPQFFYFGEYNYLPGHIDLSAVASDPTEPAADAMQTARALLKLAGTSPSQLGGDDYEDRKAELEAVSNDLTRQMREYWHQSDEIEVTVDVEMVNEQRPNGQVAVARSLNVRVTDRRHGYSNNFDERSSGFRWFFSFLAAFSEFEDLEKPVIILLDEPALTLHGKAQADFLRFIQERIAPAGQVIYTTHSPFMVQPGALQQVRIVEDKGADLGSVTSSEVLLVSRDSLFPLQGALGYDVAQSLFIGPDNILVEGTSDFAYLKVLSDHLRELGREPLDESWMILPTGGAQNIPAFVALLGGHLDVTVLIDSGTKGMQRLTDLTSKDLLNASRLVLVSEILQTKFADIEDLFTPGDYLKLYNTAFGSSIKVSDLPQGDRILMRIAAHTGSEFSHGKPADALLRDRARVLPSLAVDTLARFEALFSRLNATRGT